VPPSVVERYRERASARGRPVLLEACLPFGCADRDPSVYRLLRAVSPTGASEANRIGPPEPGTPEALLNSVPGPLFIPTDVPVRTGSARNLSFAASLADFNWLAI
jgi:hypothetical protein